MRSRITSGVVSAELLAASRIADTGDLGDLGGAQLIQWSKVAQVLVRNRVPLLRLRRGAGAQGCPLWDHPYFLQALQHGDETYRRQRAEYAVLREAFDRLNIMDMFIKSTGLPPSFPYTSDNLDILVERGKVPAAREALLGLGYVELRNVEEPDKFLFRRFIGGKSVSAVHIHGLVGWGVPFMDEEALWAGCGVSTDDPQVRVPAPSDAVLITLAHAFYENKSFKLLDLVRLRHCFRSGKVDVNHLRRVAESRGWLEGLAFSLGLFADLEQVLFERTVLSEASQGWIEGILRARPGWSAWRQALRRRHTVDLPFRMSFVLGKLAYYKKVVTDRQRSVLTRASDVVRTLAWGVKLKLRVRGQRGMILALSGIDGAGKSHQAEALMEALEMCELRAVHLWTRIGSANWWTGLARRIIRRGDHPVARHTGSSLTVRRKRLQHPIWRTTWVAANICWLVVRFNVRVRVPRLFGAVVVCDRYLLDALVEAESSLGGDGRPLSLAWAVLRACCPRPDLTWVLDIPAETAVARQADETDSLDNRAEFTRQRERYTRMAQLQGAHVVDASQPQVQVASRLVHEALSRYYTDYATVINGLLLSNPSQMNPKG